MGQAMSYPMEMSTLQTLYQGMYPNHCLKGLNTKTGGGGPKNLHFSHLWGVQHISCENIDKKIYIFHIWGSKNIPYLLQWVKLCFIQCRCQHFKLLSIKGPKSLSKRFKYQTHISFENMIKKSAFFSFVGSPTYIL